MKEILLIHYSQTGQLTTILHNILAPLKNAPNIKLSFYNIAPKNAFEFPWNKAKFFDTFPETFLQIPQDIQEPKPAILKKNMI